MSESIKTNTTGCLESESSALSFYYSGSIVGKDENNTGSYVRIGMNTGIGAETYAKFDFDFSTIPEDLIIDSVTLHLRCKASDASLFTISSRSVKIYNAQGVTIATSGASGFGTSETVVTLATDEVTRAELDSIGVLVDCYVGYRYSDKYAYVYGGSITIEGHYASGTPVRYKVGGAWKTPTKVLYKQEGTWTDITDTAADVLPAGTKYKLN